MHLISRSTSWLKVAPVVLLLQPTLGWVLVGVCGVGGRALGGGFMVVGGSMVAWCPERSGVERRASPSCDGASEDCGYTCTLVLVRGAL